MNTGESRSCLGGLTLPPEFVSRKLISAHCDLGCLVKSSDNGIKIFKNIIPGFLKAFVITK